MDKIATEIWQRVQEMAPQVYQACLKQVLIWGCIDLVTAALCLSLGIFLFRLARAQSNDSDVSALCFLLGGSLVIVSPFLLAAALNVLLNPGYHALKTFLQLPQ